MPDESSKLKRLAEQLQSRITPLGEGLIVLLSALVSLGVHAYYRAPGLGESDAARFARIAFGWHVRRKMAFDDVGYQIRTSTLYIQLEKIALDRGMPLHALPNVVNWVSVVAGTACSVALYVLFRKLTTRPIAIAATLMYTLTPGFWLGNIYGMPTVPGLFFFLLSLIVFLDASRAEKQDADFFLSVALAWLFMTVAMTIKSDLVLCGGAFLGAALARPTGRLRLVACAIFVVVGGTAASIGYAHAVISPSAPVVATADAPAGLFAFLKNWNETFGISLDALLTDTNNTVVSRCAGGLLFGVIVLALCYGLVIGDKLRKQALLALLWGLPPILSWGVRFGNSARHNVPAFPPLVLFAAIFLFEIVKHDKRRGAILVAATMFLSYFSNTAGENALKPQSNLIALSDDLKKFTQSMHDKASVVAETPGVKRAVIAGYADPWTEFEVMSRAKKPHIEIGSTWVLSDGDQITVIDYSAYMEKKPGRELARKYRRDGFEVMSLSYKL